ncbi:hypothetical protein PHJA_001480000 [Phtheirospermum japonicum]|uniref:Uncharacterized protein n=1 Tax=Phtheirospermum japonicum TaxID=374723 RepID=A0A830C2P1_9LAMI|nr:hypothetical protein PHJA_001480000 [Phtheirospermum japonicum]
MDKGFGNESSSISSSSAPITNSSSTDMFLKQVNKNSLKIAKPIRKPISLPNPTIARFCAYNPCYRPEPAQSGSRPTPISAAAGLQHQQKRLPRRRSEAHRLPAHEHLPTPPPPAVTHPRPPSSRLQRIRPPPLAQIGNRPDSNNPDPPPPPVRRRTQARGPTRRLSRRSRLCTRRQSPRSPPYMRFLQNPASSLAPWNGVAPIGGPPPNEFGQRPPPPFSPLQPTESPVSAYLRLLQNSSGSSSAPPQQPTQQPLASSAPIPAMPLSPLPFGCIPSPRSPYGMMARGFPFSPAAQLGLPQQLPPLSPTPPVPSPRWKGI